ncbi:hypothetical protein LBM341_02832 [Ralstonia solanacearum]|nr:hypothetical protein LBM341_02832 [Ralstonia solanacearum]
MAILSSPVQLGRHTRRHEAPAPVRAALDETELAKRWGLTEIAGRIAAAGEQIDAYIDVKLTVPSSRYRAQLQLHCESWVPRPTKLTLNPQVFSLKS